MRYGGAPYGEFEYGGEGGAAPIVAAPRAGYGTRRYGGFAYGGSHAHTPPTVFVSAVSPVGPTFLVMWTYNQDANVPQALYRVEVGNVSLTTTYYDSGWLAGADTSKLIDAVAEGIPTDTTGHALGVRVSVRSADGRVYLGISEIFPFDLTFGTVTVSILSPVDGSSDPVYDDTGLTVTGTYNDTASHPLGFVRLRLLGGDSDFVFSDTGFITVPTSAFSAIWHTILYNVLIAYTLTAGSHYRVGLTARSDIGIESAEVFASFWYLPAAEVPTPDNADVGTIYEVAIDGIGYMLFDGQTDLAGDVRSELLRRTRGVQDLNPPRLATSQTPFTEAIERYTFFGQADWRGGQGQLNADRDTSDPSMFFESSHINPFDPGEFKLLPPTGLVLATPGSISNERSVGAVTIRDGVVVRTGAGQLTILPDLTGGTPIVISPTSDGSTPVAVDDLASDGQYWYAPGSSMILRGQTTDPAAAWSTVPAVLTRWAGQRLCVAYESPDGVGNPNVFSTLNGQGLEEVAGGRITLPVDWRINDVTGGDGFVWFAAEGGTAGVIYKWDLTAATPSVAWELPVDQFVTALFWYQGQVFIRANRVTASGNEAFIYVATHQQGNLIPRLLCDPIIGNDSGNGTFGANDRFVFFSQCNVDGTNEAGLGAVDVSTGGWAHWLTAGPTTAAAVRAIFEFNHQLCFLVEGHGLYAETTNFAASGSMSMSIHDGASGVDKVWDRALLRFLPLPANAQIVVAVSYDGDNSYATPTGGTISGSGRTSAVVELGSRSASASLRVTLVPDPDAPTQTPAVTVVQLQTHPIGKADLVLELPVSCGDSTSDLNGHPLKENGAGVGSRRARLLESLIGQSVNVQDVDWADSGITERFEVTQVRRVPIPGVVKERQSARARLLEVAIVTLRKSLK